MNYALLISVLAFRLATGQTALSTRLNAVLGTLEDLKESSEAAYVTDQGNYNALELWCVDHIAMYRTRKTEQQKFIAAEKDVILKFDSEIAVLDATIGDYDILAEKTGAELAAHNSMVSTLESLDTIEVGDDHSAISQKLDDVTAALLAKTTTLTADETAVLTHLDTEKDRITTEKSNLDKSKGGAMTDLNTMETALGELNQNLDNLVTDCNTEMDHWAAKSTAHTDEANSILRAIQILQSQNTKAATDKLDFTALMQIMTRPEEGSKVVVNKVLDLLHSTTGKTEIKALIRLVETPSAGENLMRKVLITVVKMIVRLTTDQVEDDRQKAWCDNKWKLNAQSALNIDGKQSDIEQKHNAAVSAKNTAARLRIVYATAIAEGESELRLLSQNRDSAVATYNQIQANLDSTHAALGRAIEALKDFYDLHTGSGTSESNGVYGTWSLTYVGETTATGASESGSYGGHDNGHKGDGTGIIEVLTALQAKVKSEISAEKGLETDARVNYETEMGRLNKEIAILEENMAFEKTKEGQAADSEDVLTRLRKQEDRSEVDLEKWQAEIENTCPDPDETAATKDGVNRNYWEARQDARAMEKGVLEQVKILLEAQT